MYVFIFNLCTFYLILHLPHSSLQFFSLSVQIFFQFLQSILFTASIFPLISSSPPFLSLSSQICTFVFIRPNFSSLQLFFPGSARILSTALTFTIYLHLFPISCNCPLSSAPLLFLQLLPSSLELSHIFLHFILSTVPTFLLYICVCSSFLSRSFQFCTLPFISVPIFFIVAGSLLSSLFFPPAQLFPIYPRLFTVPVTLISILHLLFYFCTLCLHRYRFSSLLPLLFPPTQPFPIYPRLFTTPVTLI